MNVETISILCTGIVVGAILTAVFYLIIGLQEEAKKNRLKNNEPKKDKQDVSCNEDCEAIKSYQRANEELSSENEYLLASWKNAETRLRPAANRIEQGQKEQIKKPQTESLRQR